MSGIVGIVNFDGAPIDEELLRNMLQRMKHRGPDAQNIFVEGNVGFGHALYRNCEQDIEQPFTLGDVTVTAHVRIDARDDLIPRLRLAGFEAALDAPDVELLAKAYLAWGEDCLSFLLGDFAFILWDARNQKVFAARDRFGTQPLYYAHRDHTLIVSSEIGSIRLHPLVSPTLNEQAIGDFLVLNNVRWLDKTQTIFSDITSLPSAHQLAGMHDQVSTRRYWLPPVNEPMLRYKTEEEYVEHFLSVFKKTVQDRIRAKRIVLQLSGGLDAPSIAVMAYRLIQSGDVSAELNALTVVTDRIHPYPEAFYARLIAQKLQIPHHILTTDEYLLTQPLVIGAEPDVIYQTRAGRAGIEKTLSLGSVALAGHGGDEILYSTPLIDTLRGLAPWDGAALLIWEWRFMGHRPSGLRALLSPRRWRKQRAWANFPIPIWINPDFMKRLHLKERLDQFLNWEPPAKHRLQPGTYKALLWPTYQMTGEALRPPSLTYYDTLCPFLDIRLINFILRLPPQPWLDRKYLLRRAMRGSLPKPVLARKKTPAGAILNSLLFQPGAEWVDHWKPVPDLEPFVRRDAVPYLTGDAASEMPAIDIRPLMLNEWLREYRNFEGASLD